MTWQKHGKHSLLTVLSGAVASILPGARTSLYQPSLGYPRPDSPHLSTDFNDPYLNRAKIIPFPGPAQTSSARSSPASRPFLVAGKLSSPTQVPILAAVLSPQFGLR